MTTAHDQFEWRDNQPEGTTGCFYKGNLIAWLEVRPAYCDRGHWRVNCELPDIDTADGFPRYFMSRAVAIAETEAFLRWRMFKIWEGSK